MKRQGCQGFLAEYYLTNGRCGDCGKNTKCMTFTDLFYCYYLCEHFFVGHSSQLKESLLYLSFGILLEKETFPFHIQKDSLYWG